MLDPLALAIDFVFFTEQVLLLPLYVFLLVFPPGTYLLKLDFSRHLLLI